jgi:hypothetical protein
MATTSRHPTHAPIDLTNAGGGTALLFTYFGLIPGVLPTLALTALVVAVLVLPVIALGLAVAVVIGPPYGIWRLAMKVRRPRAIDLLRSGP